MFSIVKAEKGSYDSNIVMSVIGYAKNKPEATEKLIDILVDEWLMRMNDSDLKKYESLEYDYDLIRPELRKEIEEKFKNKEKYLYYDNGESFILLNYNKKSLISGYTIPCSSLNEYQGESVLLVMG